LLDSIAYPGHTARRVHALPQRTGAALMASLNGAAERAGAMLVTNARVHEVWCDAANKVLGVGCVRPDGRVEYVQCDALLLACNGYGGNPAMVSTWLPEMRDAVFAGHKGNDGSAIAWGWDLGARLADLGGYQGHGSWAIPQGGLITWALMMEGGVQVNRLGQRFHDETRGYSEASVDVLAQPAGVAWNVFDDRLLALGRTFPDFVQAEASGAVRHARNADALATLIGCDVSVLRETLGLTRIMAPYYAVKVTGALFHTQGGLDVDASCRVLQGDGTPFPNLLAAGGAARGVSGNAVWGYLSGNGLLSAVAGGFIAARTIRRQIAADPAGATR
jgi:fumarate reductase flavoprotein subunit